MAVGAGFSFYNPDPLLTGHILGGTLWVDYTLPVVPHILRGLGIEAEARDLNLARSNSQEPNLRVDTAEGGAIYSWPHFHDFRPYGKFLMGFGNLDQNLGPTLTPHHDSRTLYISGAGVDYRVFRGLWLRGDYEYQIWPDMHFHNVNGKSVAFGPIYPQGFTVGAMYHF